MNVWFEENKQRQGPVSETDLPDLVAAGRIKEETLVWHKYLNDWTPFSEAKHALLPNQVPPSPMADRKG